MPNDSFNRCLIALILSAISFLATGQNRVSVQVFIDVNYQRDNLKKKDQDRLIKKGEFKAIEDGCKLDFPGGLTGLDKMADYAIKYSLRDNDIVQFYYPDIEVKLQLDEESIVPDPTIPKKWAFNAIAEVQCVSRPSHKAFYKFSSPTDPKPDQQEEVIFKARLIAAGKAIGKDLRPNPLLDKKFYRPGIDVTEYVKKKYSRRISRITYEEDILAPQILRSPIEPNRWKVLCFDVFKDSGSVSSESKKNIALALEAGFFQNMALDLKQNLNITKNALIVNSDLVYTLEVRVPLSKNMYIGILPTFITGLNIQAFGDNLLKNETLYGGGLSFGSLNHGINPRFAVKFYPRKVGESALNWLITSTGMDFFRGRFQFGFDFGLNFWISEFKIDNFELRQEGIEDTFHNTSGYIAIRLAYYLK